MSLNVAMFPCHLMFFFHKGRFHVTIRSMLFVHKKQMLKSLRFSLTRWQKGWKISLKDGKWRQVILKESSWNRYPAHFEPKTDDEPWIYSIWLSSSSTEPYSRLKPASRVWLAIFGNVTQNRTISTWLFLTMLELEFLFWQVFFCFLGHKLRHKQHKRLIGWDHAFSILGILPMKIFPWKDIEVI